MNIFYSDNINDEFIFLNKLEFNHCINVMRCTIGDLVNVVDGLGNLFKCEMIEIGKKECKLKILEEIKEYNSNDYYIHIAISPIKNHNKIELFIEKAVEIGADEISFIDCERTLRKNVRVDKIKKCSISAMKQTLKAKVPRINDIISFNEFVEKNNNSNRFICHLQNDDRKTLKKYNKLFKTNLDTCILIGPEGDFSLKEINFSMENSFKPISIGNSRLRTETAGIVACQILNFMYSDD